MLLAFSVDAMGFAPFGSVDALTYKVSANLREDTHPLVGDSRAYDVSLKSTLSETTISL